MWSTQTPREYHPEMGTMPLTLWNYICTSAAMPLTLWNYVLTSWTMPFFRSASDCVFCKIAAGNEKTKVIRQTDNVVVFKDIHPVAEFHLLAVPKVRTCNNWLNWRGTVCSSGLLQQTYNGLRIGSGIMLRVTSSSVYLPIWDCWLFPSCFHQPCNLSCFHPTTFLFPSTSSISLLPLPLPPLPLFPHSLPPCLSITPLPHCRATWRTRNVWTRAILRSWPNSSTWAS